MSIPSNCTGANSEDSYDNASWKKAEGFQRLSVAKTLWRESSFIVMCHGGGVHVVRNRLGMTPKSSALRRPLPALHAFLFTHSSFRTITHSDQQPVNSRLQPLAPSTTHETTLVQKLSSIKNHLQCPRGRERKRARPRHRWRKHSQRHHKRQDRRHNRITKRHHKTRTC